MVAPRRPRRNAARYVAPLVLIGIIAVTVQVVRTGLKTTAKTPAARVTSHLTPVQRRFRRVKYYLVRPGDSLTAISARTGVPLGTIQALNPNLDPNTLQPNQRVRLR
ncbi:MAG: LysM peptidoglycan-binding domain-containing protein [Solirubrobacteraceae bacterium]